MNGAARKRILMLGAFVLIVAPAASAQPVGIEHQDVACIVAGQFPVLDACFRPGPSLAKARVYFRPEGVPNWYYVEATAPAPPKVGDPADLLCRRATLPKPKKSLLQKHVEYYVEATGKKQESIQTETYSPLVVKDAGECKKKLIAGFVPSAVVQVFPSLPAAFAAGGGLSTAAVAAVVGAGVAGGTGAVVAATSGGGDSNPPPTNPPATAPAPVPPPTPAPTTTVTTTLPAAQFNPVFKVFKAGVLQPGNSISGAEPLQLRFAMCESTPGPFPLKFNVLVNGTIVTAGCDTQITFTSAGFAAGFGAVVSSRGEVRTSAASFSVLMQMQSDGPNNDPKANRPLTVDVSATTVPTTTTTSTTSSTTSTTTTTTTSTTSTTTTSSTSSTTTTSTVPSCGDTTDPVGGVATPKNGESYGFGSFPSTIPFTSFWTDASPLSVEYFMVVPSSGTFSMGTSSTAAGGYPVSVSDFSGKGISFFGTAVTVYAEATDICGNVGTSTNIVPLTVGDVSAGSSSPPEVRDLAAPGRSAAPWVSQLEVPGARAQVVLNGSDAVFPAAGRVPLVARIRAGENRVEAQLVQAQGRPGLWRFELRPESLVPGSLRVIAGDVALVAGDAVVFRMKGRPGERVVFVFRSPR